jgi:hemerythrin-like domain-containing protein
MSTIIQTLVAEHVLLNRLFDEIGRLLPEVKTVEELRLLTRLVNGVLTHHADLEDNLAYTALDHALAEKGLFDQLHVDHQEFNQRLADAGKATEVTKGVGLLQTGLKASRDHFRWEEQTVFPLLERLLTPTSLQVLAAGASSGGRLIPGVSKPLPMGSTPAPGAA